MAQLELSPYINFRGKAHEAMAFYQSIFGGEVVLLTFDPNGPPKPAGPDDKIMHCRLEADGLVLMGSDGYEVTMGDNISIALSGIPEDEERMTKMFAQLSDGGKIKQELIEESWGTFGWLEDKFSINWMINISKA